MGTCICVRVQQDVCCRAIELQEVSDELSAKPVYALHKNETAGSVGGEAPASDTEGACFDYHHTADHVPNGDLPERHQHYVCFTLLSIW